MFVRINLGVQFGDTKTLTNYAPDSIAECPPEHFFTSLQRIGHPVDPYADHTQADIDRIQAQFKDDPMLSIFMATMRLNMDAVGTPSMSVGDTIEIGPDANYILVKHTCKSIGWDTEFISPDPRKATA